MRDDIPKGSKIVPADVASRQSAMEFKTYYLSGMVAHYQYVTPDGEKLEPFSILHPFRLYRKNIGKYMPHQGDKECARRRRQSLRTS
jgi:hypothetical protein